MVFSNMIQNILFIGILFFSFEVCSMHKEKRIAKPKRKKTIISAAYGPPKVRYKADIRFNGFEACELKIKNAILLRLNKELLNLKYKQLALLMSQEREDSQELWEKCAKVYKEKSIQ